MSGQDEEQLTKKRRREQARAQRKSLEAAEHARAARRRRLRWAGAGAGLAVAVLAAIVALTAGGGGKGAKPGASSTPVLRLRPLASLGTLRPAGPPAPLGPEDVPVPAAVPLAGTKSIASGGVVDGIECLGSEQTLFHIHAHLSLFVDGSARQVPYGIGIPNAHVQNTARGAFVNGGSCLYWLHTHAADGIIHIESPVQRTFTLGDFFDIWGQKLSRTEVGPAIGQVTAIYNGKLYEGNPRDIPLNAHAQIQLEVGRPLIAPVQIEFPSGL
ncbi:MAG: hypothetical protein ACYCXW_13420 [Solirubrobacteraceae bacterium]